MCTGVDGAFSSACGATMALQVQVLGGVGALPQLRRLVLDCPKLPAAPTEMVAPLWRSGTLRQLALKVPGSRMQPKSQLLASADRNTALQELILGVH